MSTAETLPKPIWTIEQLGEMSRWAAGQQNVRRGKGRGKPPTARSSSAEPACQLLLPAFTEQLRETAPVPA